MAKINSRILVFAGAGASKAVNLSQFPTTKEFFERLPEDVTSNFYFGLIVKYLQSFQGLETIDIEHVLWALQNLSDFYNKISSTKTLEGYAIHRNLLTQIHPGYSSGNLAQFSGQLRDQINEVVGDINRIVYELYGYEPSREEISENWIDLISRLDGQGSRLELFTTNYDGVIEAALTRYADDETSRAYRGIRGVVRQSLDLTAWAGGSEWQPILLTKLHGSLDWKYGGNSIFVGDPVFTGDHKKQAIIYPGFKGTNDAPFFDVFHNHLAETLADSKLVIFIGFAFRDDYVNLLLRENIRQPAKVVCINPDKSIKFPSARVEANYIHASFDKKAIDRAMKMSGLD